MPINYYCSIGMVGSNILMNKNQLIEPVIENSADEPATPVQGQMYFDTTTGDKIMYFYNGTAWVPMDGTGSGVASIAIIAAGTNSGGIDTSLVIDASTSANTLRPMQFGGSANIGMVPDASGGTDSAKFLKGDGTWATPGGAYTAWTINGDTNSGTNTVSDGETVDIEGGKAIVTSTSTRTVTVDFEPSELTTVTAVSDDKVVITDTSASNTPKTALISDIVALAPAGTVTSVSAGDGLVKTGTAVDPIISVDYTGTGLINDAPALSGSAIEADDAILFQDDSDGDAVKSVQFTDIPLNVLGVPTSNVSFNSKIITGLSAGSADTDSVNLGQVNALVAGTGLFEGGYNATTGLTTDQSPNGAINGTSNIATGLGDFYAVTVAGTQLGVALETGDLIFANEVIAVDSDPGNSKFTIVQTGQSIATAAATDALAVKGIAGFDSATFSVTSNGFVTAAVGVTSVIAATDDDLLGIEVQTGATATPKVGLNITGLTAGGVPGTDDVLPIFNEDASINKSVSVENLISVHQTKTTYKQTLNAFTTGDTIALNAVKHDLNTFDVMVQLYDETTKETIQACVDRSTVNIVKVTGNSYPSGNITVLVSKIR